MTLEGWKYLVCVDYFSNCSMVDRLQWISSGCTVKLIRKHFMRYDIPEVVSNGDLKFDNKMMRELTYKYIFKWNPSSPDMPNSNGMAESALKQIKYLIRKCDNEISEPCQAILEFTNTPSKSTGISSAQRFFGRQLNCLWWRNSYPHLMRKKWNIKYKKQNSSKRNTTTKTLMTWLS